MYAGGNACTNRKIPDGKGEHAQGQQRNTAQGKGSLLVYALGT